MSDDLIKTEAEFLRNCATDIETGEPLDDDARADVYAIDARRIADRLEYLETEMAFAMMTGHDLAKSEYRDLINEQEARIKALKREVMRWHGLFDEKHNLMLVEKDRAEAAEARLAKAVEALRVVDDEYTDHHWGPELSSMTQVRATLAEMGDATDADL